MKRSLLALTIAAASFQMAHAAPFMPMDARGLAMGNTGVASAKRAHAPAYNPSLLSQANANDDFSIIFPQIGAVLTDEKAIIDEAQDINDKIFPKFELLVTDGNDSLENRLDALLSSINGFENIDLDVTIPSNPANVNIDTAKAELIGIVDQLQSSTNSISSNAQNIQDNLHEINLTVNELDQTLQNISNNPISARIGLATAIAVPSKKFAVAVSLGGTANISAKISLSPNDSQLLKAYVPAAEEYIEAALKVTNGDEGITQSLEALKTEIEEASNATQILGLLNNFENRTEEIKNNALDLKNFSSKDKIEALGGSRIIENGELSENATDPELTSTAEVVGVGVVDIGLSFSREIEVFDQKVAIGVTPKLQKIYTFHYGNEFRNFDDVDSDVIDDARLDYTDVNIDLGASYRFGEKGNWVAGAVVKNALGGSYRYSNTEFYDPKTGVRKQLEGGKVNLNPQVRGGIAFQSKFFNAAFDLDLVENKPVAYESATQYAALGIEFDAWKWLQLRAGYRTNLKSSDMKTVSAGIGISPFDVLAIDIAALANASDYEKEVGAVFEMGLNF